MPIVYKRASDVRINELDLSATISQTANATAGLVVVSNQGTTTPKFFSNADDFLAEFGNPNAKVSFDHYSALDYFKEGSSMWAVRAVGSGAKYSAAVIKVTSGGATVVAPLSSGVVDPKSPDFAGAVSVGETPLMIVTANKGPGSYGNGIAISVTSDNLDTPTGLQGSSASTGGALASATYTYQVSAIGKGGTETVATTVLTVVVASITSTNAVTLSWNAVQGAIGYRIYGRTGTLGLVTTVGGATVSFTDTGALSPDSAVNPIQSPAGLGTPASTFTINVYDTAISTTTPQETFTCSLDEQVDETGVQMEVEQRMNPYSRYAHVESNLASLMSTPTVKNSGNPVLLGGGANGTTPLASDINAAWNLFANRELYKIDGLINSGKTSVAIQKAMTALAEKRFDCVAFLDLPATASKAQDAVDFRNLTQNINSSFAALFGPDLLELDPINGKTLYVPPSGAMVGLMARTTRVAQPWYSIAGLNRGLLNVLDVRNSYDDGQATLLFQAQVNYMRKFVGRGIPLWEQQTLYNKTSALQFLNVRVLCNVLKRSMYDFLLYGLQEPNDDILQRQLRFGLEDYLRSVQQSRGIRSFKVIMSAANNPPALVNRGVLNIVVYLIPTLATHEISLTLAIGKQGLELSENDIAALA